MAPISGNRAQKGRFSPPARSTGTDGDIVRMTLTTERAENGHGARRNGPQAWRSEQGPGRPGGREGSPLPKGTPPRRHSPDKRERVNRRWPSRLAEVLYGAAAWGVMGLVATPCWLLVVSLPRPYWRWRATWAAVHALSFCLRIPLKTVGEPPAPGQPLVVVANHESILDSFALVGVFPEPVVFVAGGDLATHPITGPFLRGLGATFVRVDDGTDRSSVRHRPGRAGRPGPGRPPARLFPRRRAQPRAGPAPVPAGGVPRGRRGRQTCTAGGRPRYPGLVAAWCPPASAPCCRSALR